MESPYQCICFASQLVEIYTNFNWSLWKNFVTIPDDPLIRPYCRPATLSWTVNLSFESGDFSNCTKGSVSHLCRSHRAVCCHCVQIVISKQNSIMPANIRPVILESIVRLSGLGYHKALPLVLRNWRDDGRNIQEPRGYQLVMTTPREDHTLLCIMRGNMCLSASRISLKLIRWTVYQANSGLLLPRNRWNLQPPFMLLDSFHGAGKSELVMDDTENQLPWSTFRD